MDETIPTAVDDEFVVNIGTTVTLDVLLNDLTGGGGALFITLFNPTVTDGDVILGTLTAVEEDTALEFAAGGNTGTGTFSYQISNDLFIDNGNVTLILQAPPLAVDDEDETDEDNAVTISVLSNDVVADGDDLIIIDTTDGANGTVTINDDGTVTYTPDLDFNGTDTFTYTVRDSAVDGVTSTATVTVSVAAVPDDPIAASDMATTPEGTAVSIDAIGNDFDPDGGDVSISMVGMPSNGSAILQDDGTILYTPDEGFVGADSFTYTIVDTNDGSATGTVMVEVTADEESPIAVDDTELSTPEDTALVIDALANDTDPNDDEIRISAIGAVENGTAVLQDDGTILYTPDDDFFGTEIFTYQIIDTDENTDEATITVEVTPVNDPPEANDDSASTAEDTPVDIAVLGNDVDPDGGMLLVVSNTMPTNGTAEINDDGTITYTPDAGFTGEDSFTYTVEEEDEALTDIATVTVTVTGDGGGPVDPPVDPDPPVENTPPVATPDSAETDENNAVTVAVLANDTDDDGDPLTLTGVGSASNGTVIANANGTVTYTPALDFVGDDSFSYSISDGNGGTAQGTVSITVIEALNEPVAVDDTAGTAAETPVTIAVLANDFDPDGDAISLSGVGGTAAGTVMQNDDGTVTFTPNADFSGDATFSYSIVDATGLSASASVTVSVAEGANEDPTAGAFDVSTPEDTPIGLNLLAGASDPDGDPVSLGTVGSAANGTVTVGENGAVTYTPDENFFGTDSFDFTVIDPFGGVGEGVVTITVESENDAPIAVDDETAVSRDEALLLGGFIGNDIEPDGEALTVVGANGALGGIGEFFEVAGGGMAAINSDGTFLFVLDGDFAGLGDGETATVSFSYTIADPTGLTDTGTIAVTVFGAGFDDDFVVNPEDGRDDNDGIDEIVPGDEGTFQEGGIGDDLFVTGDGDDSLFGNAGRDTVDGNGGNDFIEGGAGDDSLNGGVGNDTVLGQDGTDFIEGGEGNDSLEGGFGNDKLFGGFGNDTMLGNQGNDALIGGAGNDVGNGGDGADIIFGNAGNDDLDGGAGNDEIEGGTDNDTVTGGGGADVFIFSTNDGADVITDFEAGIDTVRLIGFGPGVDAAFVNANTVSDGSGGAIFTSGQGLTITFENVTPGELAAGLFEFF
ncbi:MAG: Ig-like domain-containing protein [Pseudomonadota bacterium]